MGTAQAAPGFAQRGVHSWPHVCRGGGDTGPLSLREGILVSENSNLQRVAWDRLPPEGTWNCRPRGEWSHPHHESLGTGLVPSSQRLAQRLCLGPAQQTPVQWPVHCDSVPGPVMVAPPLDSFCGSPTRPPATRCPRGPRCGEAPGTGSSPRPPHPGHERCRPHTLSDISSTRGTRRGGPREAGQRVPRLGGGHFWTLAQVPLPSTSW